jgi:type IV pilus assembly protein PilF
LCGQGEYKNAEKYFSRAIKNPTYTNIAQAFVAAGRCQQQQKRSAEAIEYYRRALNINSKLPAALLEMADYEYKQKRYRRVRSYLDRYLQVASANPRTLWLTLRSEFYLGNKDAVSSAALKLERLFPESKETFEFLDSQERWKL